MGSACSRRSFLAGGAAGALGGAVLGSPLAPLAHAVERTPLSSSPSDLRITAVRGGLVRGQHSLVVKIHAHQGIHGCAEAVDGVYGSSWVVKGSAERNRGGKCPLDVSGRGGERR